MKFEKIYSQFRKLDFYDFLFFGIFILAAFLRLYRISDYMLFLGDEGRDVLVVKRIIVDHKFTLLGPTTSVGAMYLGPIYYYFMMPFLWLTKLDPVGPAIMVVLFSLTTIILIYKFSLEFFNKLMGIIATFFYAISPLVIIHSRSSWNPNILPFFSLLIIYSLSKVVKEKKDWWLFIAGFSFGIALQLHYLALILGVIILISLFFRNIFKINLKFYLSGFFGFILTFWPFLLFEIRHSFPNFQTILRFITAGNPQNIDSYNFGIDKFFLVFKDVSIRLFWRLLAIESDLLAKILLVAAIFGIIFWLFKFNKEKKEEFIPLLILFIWFFGGVGVLGFYRGTIYDYYFVYLFPLPFLLFGFLSSEIFKKKFWRWSVLILLIYLGLVNFKNSPVLKPPNRLVLQTKEIARFVLSKTEGKPYNFALIANHNSDHAYRYFLEIWGHPPKIIENKEVDPKRETVTDQLFVVCEEKECKPLGHPLWEIAGFGRAEIEKEWSISMVKVFKLVHYYGD